MPNVYRPQSVKEDVKQNFVDLDMLDSLPAKMRSSIHFKYLAVLYCDFHSGTAIYKTFKPWHNTRHFGSLYWPLFTVM